MGNKASDRAASSASRPGILAFVPCRSGYLMALCLLGSSSVLGVPKPLTAQGELMLQRAKPCRDFLSCLQHDIVGRNTNFYEWVQIGASDGSTSFDPIAKVARESKWKALLIEPDPVSYAELTSEENLQSMPNDYQYEQVAIGTRSEALRQNTTLYSISPTVDVGVQRSALNRLSSTSKAHLLSKATTLFAEKGLNIEDHIVASTVDCKDINQVLNEHEVGAFTKEHGGPMETFRLMTVDTEEHDAKILMDLDLEERGTVPHYLAYKQTHLSADEASQLEQKLATKFPHREVDGDAVYVWRDV